MRILITGAKGFTGKHFADVAAKNGHEVIALKANLNDVVLLNEEVLSVAPDAVVHLAAISFVGHENDEEFYRVNVVGTVNLLKALVQPGLKKARVLVASSANIYGTPDIEVIDESVIPAPVNHYAASKLAMEYMTKTWFDRLPIIITRPFNYTGVGQHENFLIPKIVAHYRRGEKVIELGNLDVSRDFSDVRDVVAAYISLLESDVCSSVVNICSGQAIALREVIQKMNSIAGYEIEVRVNPAFVRANEIPRLCGSNDFLKKIISYSPKYTFDQTLRSMFEA
ncbi:MAG: GDP-mannose 4,6-dehydratase [Methylobacter sp.]